MTFAARFLDSRNRFAHVAAGLALAACVAFLGAGSASAQLVEGKNYDRIKNPQPTESGNKIETVAGYEPEVSSQHGVHLGDSRRSVRRRLLHIKCENNALSGDDECFELTVPQIQYMVDDKGRVHMMEWNPRPTVTAE